MSSIKIRRYTVPVGQAAQGLLLTPATLGFNPSHQFKKAQISTNDFGNGSGTYTVLFTPVGSSELYPFPFSATPVGGLDVAVIGTEYDPTFESIKLTFANATSDIEVTVAFIDPKA